MKSWGLGTLRAAGARSTVESGLLLGEGLRIALPVGGAAFGAGNEAGVIAVVLVEILAVEGVFAVVDRAVDFVFGHVRQGLVVGRAGRLRGLLGVGAHGLGGVVGGVGVEGAFRLAGVALLTVSLLRGETLLLGSAVGRLRLGSAIGLLLGREALGGGETLLLGAAGAALLRAAAGGQAVAGHFLLAQLRDDGGRHHFGDDVELAVFQVVVDDETHERLAVHGEAVFLRLGGQVGFGFTGERGVVAEQALVVVGVHEHGVEGGGVLTSRAHHLFALHGLFGFLGYLNGRDGRVEDLVGGAFYPVFHASFKPRENAHQYSLYVVEIREVIPIQPAILPQMGL